jgi:hypothetical protein
MRARLLDEAEKHRRLAETGDQLVEGDMRKFAPSGVSPSLGIKSDA